jgi:hypothetical protein
MLLVGAIGAGLVVAVRGASWPPALPTVALVVVLALAVNRGAFFSTELVATSEAAVLFAAVVGFRHDAALLGPLLVALSVGPLDTVHWRQRAFVRMAYNSGSQGLAVLLGAVVFRECAARLGGSFAAVVGAAACAAVPYVLADSACGFALVRSRGDTSARDALRHQWSLNGLAFPLACVGAAAGYLALQVGWWLTILVLLPLPWIPELVLVRARRVSASPPRTQVRLVAGASLAVSVVVAITAVAPSSGPSGTASSLALLALAVALGMELRVSPARAVPPMAAAVVVASVVVGAGAVTVAVVASVTVTATAWALARATGLVPALVATGGAAISGALCGAVLVVAPAGASLVAEILNTAAAAVVFVVIALVLGRLPVRARSRQRRDAWVSVMWAAPVVLVAVLLANAWDVVRTGSTIEQVTGAVGFTAGVGVALAGSAWIAAPPWDSRCLARTLGARHRRRVRVAVVALATGALIAGQLALADAGRSGDAWVLVAAAITEILIAMTLGAVRQWRFAPVPRARSVGALGGLATVTVLTYVPLADSGSGWSVACQAVVLLGTAAIAWPLARFTDARDAQPVR